MYHFNLGFGISLCYFVTDNYLLTDNKVALFFTETNSRYFITRAIARVIIVREFVEVKKVTLLPVNT